MQLPTEVITYGPLWLLSMTGTAMGITKIAMWARGSKHVNGNGKMMLATEAARIEERQLGLLERVVDMSDAMRAQQKADRDKWAPALKSLMESQNRIMIMLDGHAEKLDLHTRFDQQMWTDMIREFRRCIDGINQLPCSNKDEPS